MASRNIENSEGSFKQGWRTLVKMVCSKSYENLGQDWCFQHLYYFTASQALLLLAQFWQSKKSHFVMLEEGVRNFIKIKGFPLTPAASESKNI